MVHLSTRRPIMTYTEHELRECIEKQKLFFSTNTTKDIRFRIQKLSLLYKNILKNENKIFEALKKDLHKPKVEALEGEVLGILSEIAYAKKHLASWSKSKSVAGLQFFPLSSARIHTIPYGVAVIFSPFNHPFSTSFTPLINAIAAGNCVILKPSELSEASSRVISEIIAQTFDKEHVTTVLGGKEVTTALLSLDMDTLFFTGSGAVGKIIMEAATQKTIPLTLQLGGKCPGIIDSIADVKSAARRIAWGKYWNAGQSCNTIDYVFVHQHVKKEFIEHLRFYITKFFTENPQKSPAYGRIINTHHFDRISKYLQEGDIAFGGAIDREDLYIAPTVMENFKESATIITEEIFGPILPIFQYTEIERVIEQINKKPKPLALYVFSKDNDFADSVLTRIPSGTACINDLMIQATSPEYPLGGVGGSGFGRMRGKAGFDTFSYSRIIVKNSSFDIPLRFAPHTSKLFLALLRKLRP